MVIIFWTVVMTLSAFVATMLLRTYILFEALHQDNFQVTWEQRICIVGSSDIHPGDIFHTDFDDGRPTYFDVFVRNSLLPQFLNGPLLLLVWPKMPSMTIMFPVLGVCSLFWLWRPYRSQRLRLASHCCSYHSP